MKSCEGMGWRGDKQYTLVLNCGSMGLLGVSVFIGPLFYFPPPIQMVWPRGLYVYLWCGDEGCGG